MNTGSFKIRGGDFTRAGSASSALKKLLKQVNVEPEIIRRAMIAAYEAEMNVVIHARHGNMRFSLDSDRIDIEVSDEGPGIPDIELALKDGYSTAPPRARELGFGAGMGLPNIKKSSNTFTIESVVGKGTKLNISIHLKALEAQGTDRNSIRVIADNCIECMRCLLVCPSNALRVRGGKPEIMEHLCIDCAECIEVCKAGALTTGMAKEMPKPTENTQLIVPQSLLAGLTDSITPELALAVLKKMGFINVAVVEEWEEALRNAVMEYAQDEKRPKPVISPVCPAVVNLIETRFPSLIPNLAPFLSPIEAARRDMGEKRALFAASCPCQCTALGRGHLLANVEAVDPAILRQEIIKVVITEGEKKEQSSSESRQKSAMPEDILEIYGVKHVIKVLEKVENGFIRNIKVLELYMCDRGCFGSPLLIEDPFIAMRRWKAAGAFPHEPRKAIPRSAPFTARRGVRLDADISRAIEKLSEIEGIMKKLPGKDCGICGAPFCSVFAEDIVMGKADISECIYIKEKEKDETE